MGVFDFWLILWCVRVVVVVVGGGGFVCSVGFVCGWRCWVAVLSLCVVGDAGCIGQL